MPVRYKWTAGWVAPASGKIALKWGGTAWIHPSMMRVKVGDPGGGSWVDSDYRGFPAEPVSVAINAWNYDTVSIKWGAGAGGAAVASYEVQQRNASGGVIATSTDTASPSGNFAVSDMTKYQFYVRSKSAAGLYSDWAGPVKPSIGKPASTTYTTETATRNWSAAANVGGYKDAIVGVAVPSAVVVTTVRYQISAQNGFTGALSPYNNREIYRIANSGQQERFSWLAGSVDVTVNVANYTGNGGITGMICRGAGWSTAASGTYKAVGTITVNGVETYSYQQAHTVAAVANTYW